MNTAKEQTPESMNKIFTIPNLLSFFRLLLIPLMIWVYIVKKDYTLTLWILLLSGFTDLADGYIARRFHMISNLGKMLDPVADKLTQAAMLFCLCTRFRPVIFPLVLMAFKELYMAISGILIIKKTKSVNGADWHGKIVTALLYTLIIVHVLWYNITPLASNIMIFICTAMMLVSLILYIRKNQSLLKK